MAAEHQSAAELAADLRAARRRVHELERERDELQRDGEALRRGLGEKSAEASRLAVVANTTRGQVQRLAAAYAALQEGAALEAKDWSGASPMARWAGHSLAADFSHYLPGFEQELLRLKPGRIACIRVELGLDLLAPKEVPDDRAPGFSRKELLAKVELLLGQRYAPVLLHLRERNWRPGTAQSLHIIGLREDGLLTPGVSAPTMPDVRQLRQTAEELLSLVNDLAGVASTDAAPAAPDHLDERPAAPGGPDAT